MDDIRAEIEAGIERIAAQPKPAFTYFFTRRTWLVIAKQAIRYGVRVEYKPYKGARRYRFLGGVPVEIYAGNGLNAVYKLNLPALPYQSDKGEG